MKQFYIICFSIVFLLLFTTQTKAQNNITEFADYFPLAVGNIFVYIDEEVMPPSTSTFKIHIVKDTIANNHRYYKLMRLYPTGTGYLFGWFRFDSTNANLLSYSPGNGCQPYANDKIVDSLASKKGNHCDGCMYNAINLRTCSDTLNGTYFNTTVKTKSFHHDGLVFENLIYAKGFGKVYYSGGEPSTNYYIYMKGCKINGIVYGDTLLTGVENISSEVPSAFSLSQNYPNPFNPAMKIKFSIVSSPHVLGGDLVLLKVYDITGREIQTLVNERLQAGTYETSFDGSALNSGVYFYQLTSGDFKETKKMLLIK